jgi:hypothetical protein
MTVLCEITFCTLAVLGALGVGLLVGWLGGFVYGSFCRQK